MFFDEKAIEFDDPDHSIQEKDSFVAGEIISTIILFFLICKWTDANFFPDAVLMVIVAKAVGIFGAIYLSDLVI